MHHQLGLQNPLRHMLTIKPIMMQTIILNRNSFLLLAIVCIGSDFVIARHHDDVCANVSESKLHELLSAISQIL